MSFNANTIYKAVDVDQLTKECKDAITSQSVYVLNNMFGYVHSIYRSEDLAHQRAAYYSKNYPDEDWTVEEHVVR